MKIIEATPVPCLHEYIDSTYCATIPVFDSRNPKRKSPFPISSILPGSPSLILQPFKYALGCLCEVIESHPFPTCSRTRSPIHHIDSLPATTPPCHHSTTQAGAATLPATGRQAARHGIVRARNLFVGRGAMALPPATHTALSRLSHIKRNPYTPRETQFPHSRPPTPREKLPIAPLAPHSMLTLPHSSPYLSPPPCLSHPVIPPILRSLLPLCVYPPKPGSFPRSRVLPFGLLLSFLPLWMSRIFGCGVGWVCSSCTPRGLFLPSV